MLQAKLLTDNDTDKTSEMGWKVRPENTPPVTVAPPADHTNLRGIVIDDLVDVWNFQLVGERQITTVTDDVFDRFVEESLIEHGDIWRRLAGR